MSDYSKIKSELSEKLNEPGFGNFLTILNLQLQKLKEGIIPNLKFIVLKIT